MVVSELRAEARKSLNERWGKVALITLCYDVITFAIKWLSGFILFIGNIAVIIISEPLMYGFLVSFIKIKRNEKVGYVSFFANGFSQFGKVWSVYGYTLLKLIVPIIIGFVSILCLIPYLGKVLSLSTAFPDVTSKIVLISCILLLIVSIIWGVVKGLFYSLTYYILYDNPDMPSKEIVNQSERLMKGNRWNLVRLELTFIGWSLLSTLSFGIGFFWLTPYIYVSKVYFYEMLAGKNHFNPVSVNDASYSTNSPLDDNNIPLIDNNSNSTDISSANKNEYSDDNDNSNTEK